MRKETHQENYMFDEFAPQSEELTKRQRDRRRDIGDAWCAACDEKRYKKDYRLVCQALKGLEDKGKDPKNLELYGG